MNDMDEEEVSMDEEITDEVEEDTYTNEESLDKLSKISPQVKSWIIVGAVSLITFIVVFFVTNKLINGNKKEVVQPPVEKVEKYDAYEVGDEVSLKDGSLWHVLYDSKDNVEYISLLSDSNVNDSSVLYGNVNSFLKGTYKTKMIQDLGCESSDIQELRLLAYLDLAAISNTNSKEFLPETELEKFNFPEFIYQEATVTDTIYQTEEGNDPVMICLEEESTDGAAPKTNRFCLGDSTKSLPVRPVLVISKKYVEKASEKLTSNNVDLN